MNLEDRLREVLQPAERRPTPDFADRVMAALPARRMFDGWPGRLLAAPLAVASVVAIMVMALLIGPALAPNRETTPPAASTVAASTPPPSAAAYPDGIPREIDDEPVFRGAAIDEHVERTTDDTPFLVAGYVTYRHAECLRTRPAPTSPLLVPCGGYGLNEVRDGSGRSQRLVAWTGDPPVDSAAILRVHVHDPLAAECTAEFRQRCDETIVVEAVVWSEERSIPHDGNGLPGAIDGEPVLRGDAIDAHVAVASDDASFLVAGWATGPILPRCVTDVLPSDVCELVRSIHLMESPDSATAIPVAIFTQDPTPGPVVVRVHVHDATLIALCLPFRAAMCEQTLVLEEIIWTRPTSGMRFVPRGKDHEFSRDWVRR